MPLKSGLYQGKHHTSQYSCGLVADSLPDGWGMLLMDRFSRKQLSLSVNYSVNTINQIFRPFGLELTLTYRVMT